MKNRFYVTLFGFIRKEIRQTLRDPRMRMVLFVAPIFQLIIFGVAISNDVKNVRIAASHKPEDRMMDDIYQRALASQWFVPAQVTGEDPFQWIKSGQADVAIIAPLQGTLLRAGSMQALINAQNVIRAQGIESYLKATLAEVAIHAHQPQPMRIHFDVRPLYNPTFETAMFMVPGVMSMLACLVTIILTSMSVAREREMGTLETLLSAPIEPWEVVAGKTVPYVLLGMIQVPLILAAAVLLFDLPVRGSLWLLFAATFFFVVTTVSIGLLISTIAKNQQQSMLGGLLFLFPAILLSGLMFPVENMPPALWILAQLDPLTHFIGLLRNILLKGGNTDYFLIHAGILTVLAIVCMTTAVRRFRTTL